MQIFALFMFLGMLTSFLVPESKRARLEALAGEKDDVYALQASHWRKRGGTALSGDVEAPPSMVQRGSGSSRSVDGTSEGGLREGDVEKKWWKVHAHVV